MPVDLTIVGIVDDVGVEGERAGGGIRGAVSERERWRCGVKLCRVLGPVVATAKHPTYHARKLLAVQPVDEHGRTAVRRFGGR